MKRLLCTLLLSPLLAFAQSYPVKPVRLIVPFPAGGASDLLARMIQAKFQGRLGQPLLIESRGGAHRRDWRGRGGQGGPRRLHAAHGI